jgi:chemotaxis protein histidine kinase CheA
MSSVVKVIPVKNRLGQMLRKPGGVSRTEAVTAAVQNVDTLREEFVAAIPQEIAALEEMLAAAGRKHVSKDDLDAMLRRAGNLLTLSGTFGFTLLDQVVKRFCDLAVGMMEQGLDQGAAVAVHLRTMRLVCPGGAELSSFEAGHVLDSLEQVHAHLGIKRCNPEEAAQPAGGGA